MSRWTFRRRAKKHGRELIQFISEEFVRTGEAIHNPPKEFKFRGIRCFLTSDASVKVTDMTDMFFPDRMNS